MVNEQSFESLNDEDLKRLNTSDLSSNRNREGKGVSETVKPGTARKWSHAEVDRSCAIFWANQYVVGLFSKEALLDILKTEDSYVQIGTITLKLKHQKIKSI